MLQVQRRRRFTLIELLLVLFLIVLAAGVIGIATTRAIRQERFSAACRRLTDRIQMAQDLMLVSSANGVGMDTTVTLRQQNGVFFCRIGFEGRLPEKRMQTFEAEIPLKEIVSIDWEGVDDLTWPLELRFSALQYHFPQGRLALRSTDEITRWIAFSGSASRYHLRSSEPPLPDPTGYEEESSALLVEEES